MPRGLATLCASIALLSFGCRESNAVAPTAPSRTPTSHGAAASDVDSPAPPIAAAPRGPAPIVQIVAAGKLCARRSDGTVQCIPDLPALAAIDDAAAISAGTSFTCALRSIGVDCWDFLAADFPGTTVVGTREHGLLEGTAGARQIWVGGEHACVVRADGTVACRGANQFGTLGDGTTEPRDELVAVRDLATLAKTHGPVVELGGGYSHSCARFESKTIACWGRNRRGQLGDGTKSDRLTPVMVRGIDDATAISGGLTFGCALRSTGTVACWGHNDEGQLGDGTSKAHVAPKLVSGLVDVVAISSAQMHTCALVRDGDVYCWGVEFGARPVKIEGVAEATSIASGSASCALLRDGSVVCWGSDPYRKPYTNAEQWPAARVVFER